MAVVASVVLMVVMSSHSFHSGVFDIAQHHWLSPLLLLYIYGGSASADQPRRGPVLALLTSAVMVNLGALSYTVYIFQASWRYIDWQLTVNQLGPRMARWPSPEGATGEVVALTCSTATSKCHGTFIKQSCDIVLK